MVIQRFLHWFLSIVLNAILFLIATHFFETVFVKDLEIAILISVILSIFTLFIRLLLDYFRLQSTFFTYGLFSLAVHSILLVIISNNYTEFFSIDTIPVTILLALMVMIINLSLGMFIERSLR